MWMGIDIERRSADTFVGWFHKCTAAQAKESLCGKSRGDGVRAGGNVAEEEVVMNHLVNLEVARGDVCTGKKERVRVLVMRCAGI